MITQGKSLEKKKWIWVLLVIILLLGASLRVLYLREIREEPGFSHPALDAAYHDQWARGLATGDWSVRGNFEDPKFRERPYFRAPGYAYFLAAVYALCGDGYLAPRFLQAVLGLFSSLLAFFFGRKWFGPAVGAIFAALISTYWIFIYYEGELLGPAVNVFLVLVFLSVTACWTKGANFGRGLWAGLVLGIFALFRPNALLLWPGTALWFSGVSSLRKEWKGFARLLVGFGLGTALAVAPAALRNRLVADDFVPIAANGGMSLLIGNNELADGTNHYLPGFGFIRSPYDYPEAVRGLERRLGLPRDGLEYSRASRYYTREAIKFILARPLEFLKLTARKAALFWGPREVANLKEIHYTRLNSEVLRRIPGNFPAALSLALLGLIAFLRGAAGRKSGGEVVALVAVFIGFYFLSALPFAAAARYRVPVIPGLLLFGACGIDGLIGLVSRREFVEVGVWVVALLALYGLATVELTGYEPSPAKWHYDRALAYSARGDRPAAREEYRLALEVEPDFAEARANLAALLLEAGRHGEAIEEYREAIKAGVARAETYSSLGVALEREGRSREAASAYLTALRFNPDYKEAHYNLALLRQKAGRTEEAVEGYRQAIRIDPAYAEAHNNLANLLAGRGETEVALAHYRLAIRFRPGLANAHGNLANVLAGQGKFDEAVEHYREALRLDPGSGEVHFNLALTLELKRDPEGAEVHYRKALEIAPGHAGATRNLKLLLEKKGKDGKR